MEFGKFAATGDVVAIFEIVWELGKFGRTRSGRRRGSSTIVKLEAALTESFPAGSYVGSHACKAGIACTR